MKNIIFQKLTAASVCLLFFGNALLAQTAPVPPPIDPSQNRVAAPHLLAAPTVANNPDRNQPAQQLTAINETVWNGNSWSNGLPDYETRAILNASLTTSDIIEAYDIVISDGATLTLERGGMAKIKQYVSPVTKAKIVMNEGAGMIFHPQHDGTGVPPPGTFIRNNGFVNQYSSMFMSSPVFGQTIGGTFVDPGSPDVSHAYSQFRFDSNYVLIPETEVMTAGRGYIETTNGNGLYDQPLSITPYNHEYTGTENLAASYTVPVNSSFSLLGNPYGAYLDADAFLLDPANNTLSTIFLWTRNTLAWSTVPGSSIFNFSSVDYAMYNALGGVSAGRNVSMNSFNTLIPTNSRNNYDTPDGRLSFGTGFFVRSVGAGSATFRSTMTTTGSQIFRTVGSTRSGGNAIPPTPPPIVRHRIWLNLGNASGAFRQALIGFANGATAGNDRLYDAVAFNDPSFNPSIHIYSLIPSNPDFFAIQAHGMPFSANDSFQLGYRVVNGGSYTFTATHDGLFDLGQPYWIYDTTDCSYHTLPYTFTTNSGTFNSRFKVVFALPALPNISTCPVVTSLNNSIFINNANTSCTLNVEAKNTATNVVTGFVGGPYHTSFNMNHSGIVYGGNYVIRLSNYSLNGSPVWGAYSNCSLTMPVSPPPIVVYNPLEICGQVITSNTSIRASAGTWAGQTATSYRFNITYNSVVYSVVVPAYGAGGYGAATLNYNFVDAFGNPLPRVAGYTYAVTIDFLFQGNWINGNTATPCTFTTTNPYTRMASGTEAAIETTAYPNPFANNFKISFSSQSEMPVEVKVFDMLGRLMESHQTDAKSINDLEIGNGYQSATYNILVTQGENVNTLRVVKR